MWDNLPDIVRLLLALAFVVALMGGFALLLKRLGIADHASVTPKKRRLKVIETLPLDARRRAALIQRDDKQHLVILGVNGETVVETNIKAPKEDAKTSNE